MVMKNKKSIFILAAVCCAILLAKEAVFAAFSVSVSPYEGGYDLRFEKITPNTGRANKELNVTINSDINKQYRLYQEIMQPLSTPEGTTIPYANFVVYDIRGTNKFGTMNVDQEVPVMSGRQLIYTSNQTGSPDSFTLVYGILPSPAVAPGYYKGRLAFTIDPIDASQASNTVFLDIYAQFEGITSIEVKTETGIKAIVLKQDREENRAASVAITINGGFGKPFKILQLLSEQPISSEGQLLDWQAIKFRGRDAAKGITPSQDSALSNQQQVVYESTYRGDADSFVLDYRIDDLSAQRAGKFKSRIKYLLESEATGIRLIDTLDLEIENPRIFSLLIYPENQKGAIEFLNLRPTDVSPRQAEVTLEVKSNTGKQYQVTQNMASELSNKEGVVIRSKYFTLRTEGLETKGVLKVIAAEEMKKGETVLFVSDPNGSPDKFKLVYQLAVSRDIKAGDYSTQITYSISEL